MTRISSQKKLEFTLDVDKAYATKRVWLSRLQINHFRNYLQADLSISEGQVVILGENGAGKTNLLEAVSLLAPGRGIRGAKREQLPNHAKSHITGKINTLVSDKFFDESDLNDRSDWAVAATLETDGGSIDVGTGVPKNTKNGKRIMRLDGETVSQADIGRYLSVSWLTPQMDGIFIDNPASRRRFLDRLVVAFDPAHAGRILRYEKMLRQRTQLLIEERCDDAWLNSLESVLAETAVAVTAARQSLIKALNDEAAQGWFDFPGVELLLTGDTESWLSRMPALAVEDEFMLQAKLARKNGDLTVAGPHSSDFQALHLASQTPASRSSTGQQKAMLIAVILAHARLQDRRLGRVPVMLFDDVTAHLDNLRRGALFDAFKCLGGQCWFSGTDDKQFKELMKLAQFVKISPAKSAGETPVFEVIQ